MISNINDYFKLPITFTSNKIKLNKTIISDLELTETYDPSGHPLYYNAFQPKTIFGKQIITQYTNQYTTYIPFLKDTQKLLQKFNKKSIDNNILYQEIMNIWDDVKNDKYFKEKYHYLEWENNYCKLLNETPEFLQILSIYHLSSPILSFLMPIFVLIIPFFIIQIKGLKLTFNEYIHILKQYAKNNAIGQLFTQFDTVPTDKKIYLIASASFYVFSIYQNILTCIKFHNNMKKIHSYLYKIIQYIQHTQENIQYLLLYTSQYKTYQEFNLIAKNNFDILTSFKNQIQTITPYEISFNKFSQLGQIMKHFYTIYDSSIIHECMMWSFGLNGYIDTLEGFVDNINKNRVSFCKLIKKKKQQNVFKNAYYPALMTENPICNDIHLDKNLIITGPNASGKTTILKTTIINIILSQQTGCGFYSSAVLHPFKYIHCYLNIPDTSGRDSLFQAEARRCKDILDLIHTNDKDTHFCVFDELYSGTNPEEAVQSASLFMKYLIKFKGVHCMLTTHFYDLCKDLDNHTLFQNCHMDTKEDKEKIEQFIYTYQLKNGISTVRGGMKVLRDMNYPAEITNNNHI
jgi:DNA mismatch repair ATPase MutS